MRQRYFELAGKSFKDKENQLRMSQIIALRFASDQELLELIEEAIKNNMSGKSIKMKVKDWQADQMRV